jgi:alkyl hydroperoxide reductase subunit F
MYDLIIIGAGPAGIAAAVYAARKRLKTLLISADVGGQINWTLGIENYIGYQFIEGRELIARFDEQVRQFPIDQKIGVRVNRLTRADGGFEITTESGDRFQSKTLLLATGKRPRRLNVPGEQALTGHGVTYCEVCDGPLFADQKVVVVGGGNSGVSAALDMVKIAQWVTLTCNSPLTADAVLVEKLSEAANVTILTEHQVQEIIGDKMVEAVVLKDMRTGEAKRTDAAGVFIEIGMEPNSELLRDMLTLNEIGEVPVNCLDETAVPGLYAAGDVTTVPEKQIVVAAGEGAKAALQAHRYLQRTPG